MIALICDSWENFWREVLSPWGEIKTFSDGVTLAYYLQHGGPCDLAVVAVDGADGEKAITLYQNVNGYVRSRRSRNLNLNVPSSACITSCGITECQSSPNCSQTSRQPKTGNCSGAWTSWN